MTNLLAEIKRITPLDAARLIWLEGTESLGFPVGWAMSGTDIGKVIYAVQLKYTKLFEGKTKS